MADATGFFVQFPHPGGEHSPPTVEMPWNTDPLHRRKFLIAPGRFLDADQRLGKAELAAWGEWEPPSRVERRWPPSGRLPRTLHRPYWGAPEISGFRQNTDPWVFGEQMIYSNCKQTVGGRPNSMQRLKRGSVICFGSTIGGEFCVDTVFVVASAEPWVPAEVGKLDVDEAFEICTGRSVATGEGGGNLHLTLYRGATLEEPVEGMYSFVPARRADSDDPRFLRPAVESRFINPSNRQSTWGSKRGMTMDTVRDAWESIRDQVLRADLLLAVWFQTPEREPNRPRSRGTKRVHQVGI